MYVIAGATGHVGSVAAEELLAKKEPVRVIVRSEDKGAPFVEKGAEIVVGSLDDEAFLTKALTGAQGAFVLIPPNFGVDDFKAYQRKLSDRIGAAVEKSKVPHVVLLSSIGADRKEGLGPIAGLNYLEGVLQKTGTKLTALRPGAFMENVAMSLPPAKEHGIYPSFLPKTVPMPMIATRDIGVEAARALLDPPDENRIIDIIGPAYSADDVAELLGQRLGKTLEVQEIPPEGWVDALKQGGLRTDFAELYAEMYDGFSKGRARPVGDQLVAGKTTLDKVLAKIV